MRHVRYNQVIRLFTRLFISQFIDLQSMSSPCGVPADSLDIDPIGGRAKGGKNNGFPVREFGVPCHPSIKPHRFVSWGTMHSLMGILEKRKSFA
jgi:hypothetical protein